MSRSRLRVPFAAAIGLAAAAAACGLVIDPDDLIADLGRDDAGTAPGDGGFALDGGVGFDALPPVNVPGCVPEPPTGTDGPYAVVSTGSSFLLQCPPGYLSAPVKRGKGSPDIRPATCASDAGCSCGSTTGTASCGLRARYFENGSCTNEANENPDPVTATCRELPNEDYLRLEVVVNGVTCAASGVATPTAIPKIDFRSESIACAPHPAATTGSCGPGEVPMPPAFGAVACVLVSGSGPCPSSYPNLRELSADGGVDDQRGCACACPADGPTACDGGSARLYGSDTCGGFAIATVPPGACRSLGFADGINGTLPTLTGTVACVPSAVPIGDAGVINDVRLCCLR